MSGTLNPLSYPKGKTFECEVCKKPAVIECLGCRATYYCTREHQDVDQRSIHAKICALIAPLRSPASEIGSADDRSKRERTVAASKRALIELTSNEATKFLVGQEYELAVPAALQAMQFSVDVHGDGNIDVVPAYLLLAEAYLGLAKHHMAEEFLSMANWTVLKNPGCSDGLRARVHLIFGQMYAAQDRHEDALKSLAKHVYHSSLEMGPEHIDTAEGYFALAKVFLSQTNVEKALAYCDRCVDSYYQYFVGLRNSGTDAASAVLSDARIASASAMLSSIAATRKQYLGETHIATGEVQYTLGLLQVFNGDREAASMSLKTAGTIYSEHLGADHPSTKDVERVLDELSSDPAAIA